MFGAFEAKNFVEALGVLFHLPLLVDLFCPGERNLVIIAGRKQTTSDNPLVADVIAMVLQQPVGKIRVSLRNFRCGDICNCRQNAITMPPPGLTPWPLS